jgi:hypothetical protein
VSRKILNPVLILPAAFAVLLLAGCGKSPAPPAAEPEKTAAETPPPAEQAAPAQDQAAAELAAKEDELAKREADVALKEREAELARREAELAAKEAAAKKPATVAAKPAAATTAPAAKAAPPPPPKPIIVPAGTTLSVALTTPLSTKTARKGDRFQGQLSQPVMVDGKTVVPAGAMVEGYVVAKVSGSKEIGATPSLSLTFDKLVPTPDYSVAISGQLVQTGKSEAGADTAKIAGGAIAGAIIGNQVNTGKGSVIGGVLGAAAGAAAAKNTGSEVELPAGTVVGFALDSAIEIKP